MMIKVSARILFSVIAALLLFAGIRAQSTDQEYPTPVTSNEIAGSIKARDIGDSRETSLYFLINGDQGDVFINVVTKNLDGSIDVFSAENLRPMTKITVYSDNSDGETGRVVYLRESQKLILRIEGRTPTDDPATYRIKLAGSFKPFSAAAVAAQPRPPQVRGLESGEVRVSSTGAIIESKPSPTPKTTVSKIESDTTSEISATPEKPAAEKQETEPAKETVAAVEETSKKAPASKKQPVTRPKEPVKKTVPAKKAEKVEKTETGTVEETPKTEPKSTRKTEPTKKSNPQPVDPSELSDVNLVVIFKDGRKIERPMNEVLRFGVDRGILTIVAKDGSIGRYSILDIEKITIQ